MSDANRMSVMIMDKEYQVACPPEERHDLMRAASELDNRMRAARKGGHIVGLDRIAIMVALNLCHELQNKTTSAKPDPKLDETLDRISDKLDGALSAPLP